MLAGLLQSHPGAFLIFQDAYVERERARLLLHLSEHSTRVLHLELVGHVVVALVDCRPRVLQARLYGSVS